MKKTTEPTTPELLSLFESDKQDPIITTNQIQNSGTTSNSSNLKNVLSSNLDNINLIENVDFPVEKENSIFETNNTLFQSLNIEETNSFNSISEKIDDIKQNDAVFSNYNIGSSDLENNKLNNKNIKDKENALNNIPYQIKEVSSNLIIDKATSFSNTNDNNNNNILKQITANADICRCDPCLCDPNEQECHDCGGISHEENTRDSILSQEMCHCNDQDYQKDLDPCCVMICLRTLKKLHQVIEFGCCSSSSSSDTLKALAIHLSSNSKNTGCCSKKNFL